MKKTIAAMSGEPSCSGGLHQLIVHHMTTGPNSESNGVSDVLSCGGHVQGYGHHHCTHKGEPEVMDGYWITAVNRSVTTRYWCVPKVWDDDGCRADQRKDNRHGFSRVHHILWPTPIYARVYGHLVPHVDPAITHPGLLEAVAPTRIIVESALWECVDAATRKRKILAAHGDATRALQAFASLHIGEAGSLDVECTPVGDDGNAAGPMVVMRATVERVLHLEFALAAL